MKINFLLSLLLLPLIYSSAYAKTEEELRRILNNDACEKAIEALTEENSPEVMNELLTKCGRTHGQLFENKAHIYKAKTKDGNPLAHANYGLMFSLGIAAVKDLNKAIRQLKLLADQQDAIAQYKLAIKYMDGEGVKKDLNEAARLFKLSADLGNEPAFYSLFWHVYDYGRIMIKIENNSFKTSIMQFIKIFCCYLLLSLLLDNILWPQEKALVRYIFEAFVMSFFFLYFPRDKASDAYR